MYCTNCGHKNPGAATSAPPAERRWASLRHRYNHHLRDPELEPDLEEDVHIAPEELEDGRGVLIVKRGPNAGSKFFLDSETTEIGRHPESAIFLDDITVSRRHAELRRGEEDSRSTTSEALTGPMSIASE